MTNCGEFEDPGKEKCMLSSNFRHNVDSKNRLFVPAKYREELGETFVVSQLLGRDSL